MGWPKADLGQHAHFWGERRKEREGTCSEKVPVEVDAKGGREHRGVCLRLRRSRAEERLVGVWGC